MTPLPEDIESLDGRSIIRPDKALAGSIASGDLVWSNVNLKLLEKKGSQRVKKAILQNVWGRAQAGKATAIMGASGSGSKFRLAFIRHG